MEQKNYFKDTELYYSRTALEKGINNTPSDEQLEWLKHIRDVYLNSVRELLGKPIIITSGYRSPELNKAVGGVANSNHLKAEAVDLQPKGAKVSELRNIFLSFLEDHNLPFDELIYEQNSKGSIWLHFAVRKNGINRKKVLDLNVK